MITDSRLVGLALDALEEALAAAREQPVGRTWALRLALAFLASRTRQGSRSERWPFDHYWQALEHPRPNDRSASLNAALNAIYLSVGVKRDMDRISQFEQRARARRPHVSAPDS
jgi:hypothetical protein